MQTAMQKVSGVIIYFIVLEVLPLVDAVTHAEKYHDTYLFIACYVWAPIVTGEEKSSDLTGLRFEPATLRM